VLEIGFPRVETLFFARLRARTPGPFLAEGLCLPSVCHVQREPDKLIAEAFELFHQPLAITRERERILREAAARLKRAAIIIAGARVVVVSLYWQEFGADRLHSLEINERAMLVPRPLF